MVRQNGGRDYIRVEIRVLGKPLPDCREMQQQCADVLMSQSLLDKSLPRHRTIKIFISFSKIVQKCGKTKMKQKGGLHCRGVKPKKATPVTTPSPTQTKDQSGSLFRIKRMLRQRHRMALTFTFRQ